jgi:hypothetical protein
MGTNYYWHARPPCGECHRGFNDGLHIGKSSAGWAFSLHVYPEKDIRDLPDWEKMWTVPGSYIEDEYGERILPDEMHRRIAERSHPNGLMRHTPQMGLDVRPGAGTWDLCPYDFS